MFRKGLIISVVLLIAIVLVYRQPDGIKSSSDQELTIFAASSLTDAFQELTTRFEEETGVMVNLNLASSGTLQIQIEQGAPADIFASAGVKEMEALVVKGLVSGEEVISFAGNRLVVIANKDRKIVIDKLDELAGPAPGEICLGDPDTTPAGYYSKKVLQNLGIFEQVEEGLVYGRNVRQVLQYVESGEVDLGLVYATDTIASTEVTVIKTIPGVLHPQIVYPIGVVGKKTRIKTDFIRWVISDKGQAILRKYGFVGGR